VIRFRQFSGPGTTHTVFVFLVWTVIGASALPSQDTRQVSATMLRVLAEAADADRTGRPVFFVADHRFPHQVVGPFGSRGEAERVRADSGATFGVFGPYTTAVEPTSDTASRVVGIRLTVRTQRGQETIEVDPRKVDALFLSGTATDKFVIPYYGRIYGTEYAQRLRVRLDGVGYIICHIRPSYLCIPRPNGSLSPLRVMDPPRTVPR
jgi:hypothetical protein